MSDPKPIVRLNKIASDLGQSPDVLIDFLIKNGIEFDRSKGANAKIIEEVHEILMNEFSSHKALKVRADKSNEDKFVKSEIVKASEKEEDNIDEILQHSKQQIIDENIKAKKKEAEEKKAEGLKTEEREAAKLLELKTEPIPSVFAEAITEEVVKTDGEVSPILKNKLKGTRLIDTKELPDLQNKSIQDNIKEEGVGTDDDKNLNSQIYKGIGIIREFDDVSKIGTLWRETDFRTFKFDSSGLINPKVEKGMMVIFDSTKSKNFKHVETAFNVSFKIPAYVYNKPSQGKSFFRFLLGDNFLLKEFKATAPIRAGFYRITPYENSRRSSWSLVLKPLNEYNSLDIVSFGSNLMNAYLIDTDKNIFEISQLLKAIKELLNENEFAHFGSQYKELILRLNLNSKVVGNLSDENNITSHPNEQDFNYQNVVKKVSFSNQDSYLDSKSLSIRSFNEMYGRGSVIETTVTNIIYPSQIVTEFYEDFIGRLSVLDISWCLPEAEKLFKTVKVGDRIKCVVLRLDHELKQVQLSQKHLTAEASDTIGWQRIERGDEFNTKIFEEFNDSLLLETEKGLFGFLPKLYASASDTNIRVKVNSKLDYNNLLSFVPSEFEIENHEDKIEKKLNEFSFIEEDLRSFNSFKRSILASNASDKDFKKIENGFEADPKIFSKELSSNHVLQIQFELNSSIYETTFKQNAIPYFFENEAYSIENEKKLLDLLASKNYWFKIDQREKDNKIDFSLYIEEVNFYGEVQLSKDKKECRFVIKNFSFGHNLFSATEAKKRNAKNGSFLFINPLRIVSPLTSVSLNLSNSEFLEYALLKTECFRIMDDLKKNAGEILRHEGRTLAIIDKFLEYQISLIDNEKENNIFVDKYEQIPSNTDGVAIRVPKSVADSLEINEDTIVNIWIEKNEISVKLTDGMFSSSNDGCKITFNKPVNLNHLTLGFFLNKRISKRQFLIQRDIIQDFLEKKIRIDHIESLLVSPEKIKSPILKRVDFINPDLTRTETEQPDNIQVKAIKKAIGNQNVFLIQGPPGTGKTTVIAEIIQQLASKGEKILVSGQNHVAVDNVLQKLAPLTKLGLLRVGNPERIDKELVRFSIDNLVDDFKLDFKLFLSNQLLLTKQYFNLKSKPISNQNLLDAFNNLVNEVSASYSNLKEIYKERHFILRDGLSELKTEEIKDAIFALENWCNNVNNENEILLRPLIYGSINVVFATCIGIKMDKVFQDGSFKFDTVIIDEAGKANIAETLVAIELGKKVILVGDQMQLPPYIDSTLIDGNDPKSFLNSIYGSGFENSEVLHALTSSFFEFIINKINAEQFPKENMEMLNYQHRMHPNIGKFISDSFYRGTLKMGGRTQLNRIEMPSPFNKEVIFFDTSNAKNPYEQNDGFSAKNNTEAEAISEMILPRLFENNISPDSIAIIAPYKSQVANIENFISRSSRCNFKNIDVSTLDSFQGKEYDIIVFSFTRSTDHNKANVIDGKKKYTKVGFLDDARRLNVAFSRARKKLILTGNALTLTDRRSHYDGLFNYTDLFKNLVELSKNESIGNFVNLADIDNFKNPFETFYEKYKPGDNAIGKIKSLGKKAGIVFGLFITIDNFDCLLPISLMPIDFKDKIESIEIGSGIKVIIYLIDKVNKKVSLRLETNSILKSDYALKKESKLVIWNANISKIHKGNIYKGIILKKVDYGYFVKLENDIEGLLHFNKIKGNQSLEVNQIISVRVASINFNKNQISFEL